MESLRRCSYVGQGDLCVRGVLRYQGSHCPQCLGVGYLRVRDSSPATYKEVKAYLELVKVSAEKNTT